MYSFGLNNMGQLGLGSLDVNSWSADARHGLGGQGHRHLEGGEHHSIAPTRARSTLYRGDNNQLGYGDGTDQQLSPRRVPALEGIAVRKVSTQANSNMAVSKSGDLYSWGFGEMGQLCHGKGADEAEPTLVEIQGVGGLAVLDAAAGAQHSIVVAMERDD